MKALAIIHVDFERPAMIGEYLENIGYTVKIINAEKIAEYREENYDTLIVMGGPMNIYDYDIYSWLKDEKEFIKQAIDGGKKVLGVCLGAQLIADVMGEKVYKNTEKEIGWFDIKKVSKNKILEGTKESLKVLHWHGDMFDIPLKAERIYESIACKNQGFVYDGRVLGLQFHLEMSKESIVKIIKNCSDELVDGKWIQKAEEIEKMAEDNLKICKKNLNQILDNIFIEGEKA